MILKSKVGKISESLKTFLNGQIEILKSKCPKTFDGTGPGGHGSWDIFLVVYVICVLQMLYFGYMLVICSGTCNSNTPLFCSEIPKYRFI